VDFECYLWLSCNKLSQLNTCSSEEFGVPYQSDGLEPADSTLEFRPKLDANGLLTAVVVDARSKDVLMVAFMNQAALEATIDSGTAHFWSRSRQVLWKKGETSGNTLSVIEILVDCDQDALVLRVEPSGPACHTGAPSCFYRRLASGALVRVNT
jgi:phosphoribosyl-AMP cyclohydrolase